ncbi:MAG: peptidoglycan DD-metalloendopeptidase family protein [Deltaproteobacteria bacterium]|nr:peptidoglycan DD-metalloendopeptidase family protein [Deltaproteobacteria bacterium]
MKYNYPLRIFLSLAAAVVFTVYMNERAGAEQGAENRELKSIQAAELEILQELDSLEREVERLETRLIDTQARITRLKKNSGEKKKQTRVLEKIQTRQTESLYRRLRAIYKLREGGIVQVLINSESIDDLVHKYRYLAAIIDRDVSALKTYSQRKQQIKAALNRIRVEEEDLRVLCAELEGERKKLDQTRNSKTALLMKVHQRKETYLAMIRTREEYREQLIKEVIINPKTDLSSESSPPAPVEKSRPKAITWPDFARLKGKLPLPVRGRIKDHFGRNPGLFETYNTRQGVSIIARPGSPVKAVSAGKIIFSDWLQGYGNVIIIDHGHRYYTLTAGMSRIKPTTGQFVDRGDILGNVPNAGKKDQRGIYLEIRLRGRALDPGPWFASK